MTMKESLETAIKGIRADSKIPTLDEARARVEAIDPILERLGWDRFSEDFKREFSVSDGRVDYALLNNSKPKVFIEAKRPSEDLAGRPEDQLLRYSGIRGVPLAVLTNGLNWWFYLPLKEGDAEARQFCRLDISVQDISEICNRLIEFLSRENVYSGAAVKNAEAVLVRLENDKKVKEALPRAWEELIAGPDVQLVDLINDRVKGRCGLQAGSERIKEFLRGLGKVRSVAPEPPKIENDEPINVGGIERISLRLPDLDLSKLENAADEELLHAMLTELVQDYIGAKNVRGRGTRAAVKEYMESRGFIEFKMYAEWGGVKSDRPRFCKVDICEALHAVNRRK